MTDTSRRFHIGDLISVTTRRLVSPSHIDGVYAVCNYVTGESHMTHQLPRAAKDITPWLLEQFPWLALVDVPDWVCGKTTVDRWLSGEIAIHGEFHEVRPLRTGSYEGRDPIEEWREMAPQAQIIGVVMPDSD